MPKNPAIRSVLVVGAGPIVIGQACEFDYSGTQACRALREEGIRVALLNSNPATIMTDPDMADATYIEPVNADTLSAVIKREKPDAVLPTMGGQTALNCVMELHRRGEFSQAGAPLLIGAKPASIYKAEDRSAFKQAMENIGLQCAPSAIVRDLREANAALEKIRFPVIVRPSFTLGGSGGGIAFNKNEFEVLAARGISESPNGSILMERSLLGWKEFEMEVVRDAADNCIIVCAIENMDPMGVHTGDSITVAPAQTLTDKEYQRMRDAAIAVLREIGVDTGGANVQFAVNPQNGDMVVIEMNPRVSRSSALASKATGFPIAKVAVKLAIGYTLDEIKNDIAGGAPASFEPSIDYIVTKIPRFDFDKFAPTPDLLTTQMKSVGEVMAIGRTFAESLQKAVRGLETGNNGLNSMLPLFDAEMPLDDDSRQHYAAKQELSMDGIIARIRTNLSRPNSKRLFWLADAFRFNFSLAEVYALCKIDPWFLAQIQELVDTEADMRRRFYASRHETALPPQDLLEWKRQGFSDARIAQCIGYDQGEVGVRAQREALGIHPVFKRIDTCAAEFPTATAYLYSTYEEECELRPTDNKKIIILGSGPNRIGQGIEFDYCCVHGVMALKEAGYETIMVNCNPETVSTDYDIADRLFFEPLTAEDVWEIIRQEKPAGVIVQFGGQTPLAIAHELEAAGAPIIGTSVQAIERAESRELFQKLLHECGLRQPANDTVQFMRGEAAPGAAPDMLPIAREEKKRQALISAAQIGYPLVVRPSYVLGGKSMRLVYGEKELREYLDLTLHSDILLDKFLDNAIEVDVDAVADHQGACLVAGVMEHIEQAGIHSGDSACSLPPYTLSAELVAELRQQTRVLARALGVVGLMNVQYAIRDGTIFVLEANPRASRTTPFVSKSLGLPIAKIAARAMAGVSLATQGISESPPQLRHFAVKEAVLPFNKFPDVDVLLGPEMKSTGEAMGISCDFAAAFYYAQEAILPIPADGKVCLSVRDEDKAAAAELAAKLTRLGYDIVATCGTAAYLRQCGVPVEVVNKVKEGRPHIVDEISGGNVQIVINTEAGSAESRADSFSIRRAALVSKVIYFTTIVGAQAAAQGIARARRQLAPRPLQEWHNLGKEDEHSHH